LFDVRQKKDETADSILRVSFELNNQYGSIFQPYPLSFMGETRLTQPLQPLQRSG
jgi:hypothetical protein